MRTVYRTLVLTGLLASAGLGSAFAQVSPPPPPSAAAPVPAPRGEPRGPGQFDPAQREARMQRHFADLKAKLRITPQQEGAWNTFTTAVRPPAPEARGMKPDRAEFAKLTTPQRIDRMREMRARHQAEADRRGEATKAFYATLTPAQQQTFDALPPPHWGGHRGGPRHGGPGPREGRAGALPSGEAMAPMTAPAPAR